MIYDRNKLIELLKENGVYVDGEDEVLELDSLTYVTVIVDIENEFGISYPEQFMIEEINVTLCELENTILECLNDTNI